MYVTANRKPRTGPWSGIEPRKRVAARVWVWVWVWVEEVEVEVEVEVDEITVQKFPRRLLNPRDETAKGSDKR